MNNIEKHSNIDVKKLSNEFYFQSLLQEAFIQGELSTEESERIQLECLKLLADSTERYTKGQSSSVPVEIAQGIMTSNLFTIGIYLKTLPHVSAAMDAIKNASIDELYEYGYTVLKRKCDVAKYFFYLVCQTKLETQNHAYNITIDEGFTPFFDKYDLIFHAHEIPSSIDYQLIHPVSDLAGVEFIIQYLENLYYENLFCQKFDATVIDEVMCGYDQGYKDLLDNICEQVLQNALGCNLLKKNLQTLDFNPGDLNLLKNALKANSQQSFLNRLLKAGTDIFTLLEISNRSQKKYILASLPKIATTVYAAIETDTLNKVFVPRYNPNIKPITHYNMGIKMDDKAYRGIVGEFLSCRYFEDKLEIIKESIKTLADMEDIIIAGELNPEEASLVFNLLDDIEIAVLAKRHPLHQEIEAIDHSDSEIRMQQNLDAYLTALPADRYEQIQKMTTTIEVI